MRFLALALLATMTLTTTPAEARVAAPTVSRAEYAKVHSSMTRLRVQRIFRAGVGCEYVRYESGGLTYTGRQYRNDRGGWVAIRYVSGRGGAERVRGKQWDTVKAC